MEVQHGTVLARQELQFKAWLICVGAVIKQQYIFAKDWSPNKGQGIAETYCFLLFFLKELVS